MKASPEIKPASQSGTVYPLFGTIPQSKPERPFQPQAPYSQATTGQPVPTTKEARQG